MVESMRSFFCGVTLPAPCVDAECPEPLIENYSPQRLLAGSKRSSRSGVTLMEVLASICVIAVGLLGAFTMLPLAKYYLGEANKYDRAITTAQEAFESMQIRGVLDPAVWIGQGASGPVWAAPDGLPDAAMPDMSVAILDPVGVA